MASTTAGRGVICSVCSQTLDISLGYDTQPHPQGPLPATRLVGDTVGNAGNLAAENVAKSTSKWHGNVEYGEHTQPFFCWEKVSYDCRGNGGIRGLSDPHQCSRRQQHPVVLQTGAHTCSVLGRGVWSDTHHRERAQQSATSPGQNAPCNDVLANEAIAKVTKDRGAEHVGDNKSSL